MRTKCNYTFDASEKKITFTDYVSIDLSAVLVVVNVTDNIVIYNFNNPTKGGTVATNVLTLAYDTSSMDDSDSLLILYDDTARDYNVKEAQTAAAVTTKVQSVQHIDKAGATQPAGDTAARSIYTKPTDGTNGFDSVALSDAMASKRGIAAYGQLTTGAARVLSFLANLNTDGISSNTQVVPCANFNLVWNGSSWDRQDSVNTGQAVVTIKNSSGVEPGIQAANSGVSSSSVVQLVQLVDTSGRPIKADDISTALKTISDSHVEIHESNHFYYADSLTLGSAATQDYLITTPDTTKWGHLVLYVDGTAITSYLLYENADRTGTTLQTVFNNNRNSATAAGLTIHKGTSGGTTDGTQIDTYSSGFSAGASTHTPSVVRSEVEKILKQNTKYILRVTSGTTGNLVNVRFNWYEHTNV